VHIFVRIWHILLRIPLS